MSLDDSFRPYATDAEWQKVLAVREHGNQRAAAEALGLSSKGAISNSISRIKSKAAKEGHAPDSDLSHPIPPGFALKGVSDMRTNAEGKPQWVKYERLKEDVKGEMAEALEAFKEDCPRALPVPAKGQYASDLMACYPVGDHHFGMLAWRGDAGGDYDLKIGEQLLVDAFCHLVRTAPQCQEAAIVLLGDFMHYDSMEAVTPTHGHHLDADSRPSKMIRAAIRSVRAMITEALEHHGNIKVIVEIGNHDLYSSLWLMETLACFYENEPRVTVDTSPKSFHYFTFGSCLVGTHHGHRVKLADLPLLMATDLREEWGAAKHCYWWTGHVHHDQVKDFNGCRVESFRILPPTDAHAENGGYRSGRDMKAIILHREFGEVARHLVTPEMLR